MSVISVQLLYCIVFTAAFNSFEMLYQNKPFDVHERFMADTFKVKKKVSRIVISCQQTKPMSILTRYIKLLGARTNYKGGQYS